MSKGTIKKVAGPLVIAEGMRDANMYDVVRVSEQLFRKHDFLCTAERILYV